MINHDVTNILKPHLKMSQLNLLKKRNKNNK